MALPACRGSVCIVANDLDYIVRNGGIGTCNWLMARLLADNGWRVHVLYCGPTEDPGSLEQVPQRLRNEGISFSHLDQFQAPPPAVLPAAGQSGYLYQSDRVRYALQELHRLHRFDLVEFGDWQALGFRTIQAKRSGFGFEGVRFLVKLHSSSQWLREGNDQWLGSVDDLRLDFCERYAFEHADCQVAPCRYMLDYARSIGWDVRSDACVIPYALPEPAYAPSWGSGTQTELVFFGRLETRKGLRVFLDAALQLDPGIPLTFLGKNSLLEDGTPALDYIAARLRGRPHSIYAEWNREQALRYLATGNRLAVIASLADNSPNTVIECMVHGIPFLASRVGGIPELIPDAHLRECLLFAPRGRELGCRLREYLGRTLVERRALCERLQERLDVAAHSACVADAYTALLRRPLSTRPTPECERPLVTVAVTYYNLAEYLPEALAALAAQSYRHLEVIVVDDGSTSPIAVRVFEEQAQRYPSFRFVSQANAGPAAARNRALADAAGEFFIPVDADNVPRADMVERFVDAMLHRPDAAALTCYLLAFRETEDLSAGRWLYAYRPTGGPHVLAFLDNVYGDSNAIFRTADLRTLGGYPAEHHPDVGWEDFEVFVRLVNRGYRVDVVPEPLFYYRHRDDSLQRRTNPVRNRQRVLRQLAEKAQPPLAERLGLWTALWSQQKRIDQLGDVATRLHGDVAALRSARDALDQECRLLQSVNARLTADNGRLQAEGAWLLEHSQRLHAALQALPCHLRYRVADALNSGVKRLPLVHGTLKRSLSLSRRAWARVQRLPTLAPVRIVRAALGRRAA